MIPEQVNPNVLTMSNNDKLTRIFDIIREELKIATTKHPNWPDDPIHAAAIVNEECGELVKSVLEATYEPGKSPSSTLAAAMAESIQVAAMAIRFYASMLEYRESASAHHEQTELVEVLNGEVT